MNLASVPNSELLNRVEKLARTERKITHLILWHLVEVESRRLYLDLGYTSLFKYLTAHLQYSEDAAYRRIQAAKLLKKMPSLDKPIESGLLNLTQLTQVQKCLNSEIENGGKITLEKTESILEQIQYKSTFETKKILAIEFNQPIQTHETLNPQGDDSTCMELTFNEEQMADLQHAKDLLSHALHNPTWAELISYLAKSQVQKKLGKASATKDHTSRSGISDPATDLKKPVSTNKTPQTNQKRKPLKISLRRTLLSKASHHCEFVHKNGERCNNRYQLQIDHRIPLALGGANEITNYRVLCRTHNLAEARRMGIN